MGTLQNRLHDVFEMIAEACAGLDAQLVLALGRPGASLPRKLPGDPIVVGYAPQMALLRRATLVITHAGLNTTLECLTHGLPLLALPVTNDQPGVAARVEHLGVGKCIPVKKVTVARLRQCILDLMGSPSYKERALKCADEIRRLDGPTFAAELIERAFTTRQPVRRQDVGSERGATIRPRRSF